MRGENQIVVPRVNRQVANGNRRKMVALELRPAFPAINRNPESKLRTDAKKIWHHEIFFEHVSVSTNALRVLCTDKRHPGLTVISSLINIWSHVAKSMPIKSRVSRPGTEVAGLHPVYPRVLRQPGNVADNIGP